MSWATSEPIPSPRGVGSAVLVPHLAGTLSSSKSCNLQSKTSAWNLSVFTKPGHRCFCWILGSTITLRYFPEELPLNQLSPLFSSVFPKGYFWPQLHVSAWVPRKFYWFLLDHLQSWFRLQICLCSWPFITRGSSGPPHAALGWPTTPQGGRLKYSTQYRHSFDGLIFDIHRLVHNLISFAPCSHNFIYRVCPSFANENIVRDSRKLTNFQMHNFYFSPPIHEAYHPEEMWVNLTDCPWQMDFICYSFSRSQSVYSFQIFSPKLKFKKEKIL